MNLVSATPESIAPILGYLQCSPITTSRLNSRKPPTGRAPAMATEWKTGAARPGGVRLSAGDGHLASIGMAEGIHAANHGEKLTALLFNNAVYE